MVTCFTVGLTPSFHRLVEQWIDDDQDVLLGFISALAEFGFDVICGARTTVVEGLTIEFVEPGEIPELVWARVFLELVSQRITLRIHQSGDAILIEAG